MLNRECEEVLLNDQGKFIGIKSEGEVELTIYLDCFWKNFNR